MSYTYNVLLLPRKLVNDEITPAGESTIIIFFISFRKSYIFFYNNNVFFSFFLSLLSSVLFISNVHFLIRAWSTYWSINIFVTNHLSYLQQSQCVSETYHLLFYIYIIRVLHIISIEKFPFKNVRII